MGKQWKQKVRLYIWGSKITADGDCSHEIKRHLLLGRKVMTNLDSILKSRDITLPTKVHLVKAMVFPVVMYDRESWTIKKAERQRIDAFELWCWRRLLRVPWTARRSNQSILKEISPGCSLEGLMLKLQYFQFSSVGQSCLTLCNSMNCSVLGFSVHHQLPELAQTHVHWVSDAIQPPHPLSSPSPPAFNLSQHQGFCNELALLIRWPKYWSFSFSISPSNEYSGLISFRMDWLDLLAVHGTLKSLLQHHSSKASVLWHSAFFIHTWLLEKP